MPFRWNPREHVALGQYVLKWLAIAVPAGAVVRSAVAGFLWALDKATQIRWSTDMASGVPWLLFLLPVAGIGIGLMYHAFGKAVEGGNKRRSRPESRLWTHEVAHEWHDAVDASGLRIVGRRWICGSHPVRRGNDPIAALD
jgi:hypothetical protein